MDHNTSGTNFKKWIREICIKNNGTTQTIMRQRDIF